MPNEREFVKKQLSEVKEKILVVAKAENAKKRWQQKWKAKRNFEKKNLFKFTKELFEGKKNGVLNSPKEELEAHLQKKYTDPLTDTPQGHLNKPNHSHPLEEKFDDSPLKRGEIKDFVRKAWAKSSPGINSISALQKMPKNISTPLEAFTRSLYKEIYCGELGISRWNPHTKRKRLEK